MEYNTVIPHYNTVMQLGSVQMSVNNKTKILEAASQLLLSQGVSGMSVRAIAKLAGLSTIGIYSHFQGKQGILDALYIEGFSYIQEAMKSVIDIEDPKLAILSGVRKYLEVAHEQEATYRLIFGEADNNYTPGDDASEAGINAFASLITLCSKALPETANATEQQEAALRIWALVHGYVSLQHHAVRNLVSFKDWTQQVEQAAEDMLDSIQLKYTTSTADTAAT